MSITRLLTALAVMAFACAANAIITPPDAVDAKFGTPHDYVTYESAANPAGDGWELRTRLTSEYALLGTDGEFQWQSVPLLAKSSSVKNAQGGALVVVVDNKEIHTIENAYWLTGIGRVDAWKYHYQVRSELWRNGVYDSDLPMQVSDERTSCFTDITAAVTASYGDPKDTLSWSASAVLAPEVGATSYALRVTTRWYVQVSDANGVYQQGSALVGTATKVAAPGDGNILVAVNKACTALSTVRLWMASRATFARYRYEEKVEVIQDGFVVRTYYLSTVPRLVLP
jgi:hypothetical protein